MSGRAAADHKDAEWVGGRRTTAGPAQRGAAENGQPPSIAGSQELVTVAEAARLGGVDPRDAGGALQASR